jgi:hypothetical protein
MAVFDAVLGDELASLFIQEDTLDSILSKKLDGLENLKGYEGGDLARVVELEKSGEITKEARNDMILDGKKAQRMYTFYVFLHQFFYEKVRNETDELRAGDTTYIWGHPDYLKKFPNGSFRGENVHMVGYNNKGLRMFLGFGPNFQSGPKVLKDIQMWLAYEFLGEHEEKPEYRENIVRAITHGVREGSPFLKAFLAVRENKGDIYKARRLSPEQMQTLVSFVGRSLEGGGRRRKGSRRMKKRM